MDTIVITQKLESLRRCIDRISSKCPPDLQQLQTDPDLQDIIVLNLTRSVQLCVDTASHIIADTSEAAPTSMGESFSTLARIKVIESDTADHLRKAVGFRNITVHNYAEINWAIVFSFVGHQLDDFRQFAKSVASYCNI